MQVLQLNRLLADSLSVADMFICNNDHRSYKINHSFDCNEKCLIYLLTCNCCQKQYVGFWISGVFMYLNFVTDFIQVCYCIAVAIILFATFHCFLLVVPINNVTPPSLFYIIVITFAILYIRNYSLV